MNAAPRVLGRLAEEPIPWSFRLHFVARNMLRRWRKTLGATLGVGVALAVVVAMLGVAGGGTYIYTGEYIESQANLYAVTHGGAVVAILPGDSPGIIENARSLLNQVRAAPDVHNVVGVSYGMVEREKARRADGKRQTDQIFSVGIWGNPTETPGMLVLHEGRWIRQINEIVVAPKVAEGKGIRIDDTLTIGSRRFQVVGIGFVNGVGIGGRGAAYFAMEALSPLSGAGDTVSIVIVESADPAATAAYLRDIRNIDVYPAEQAYEKILGLLNAGIIFYYMFSMLGLAIAGLFVANVLTVSVGERRLEFATLRAIGVPRRFIMGLVVGEALIIVLLAYVLGSALGFAIGSALDLLYAPLVKVEKFVVFEPMIFVRVFLIAVGLSLVSGLLPARSALRVQPAEALREA